MAAYATRYPRTVVVEGSPAPQRTAATPAGGIEQLHVAVVGGTGLGRVYAAFARHGFVQVRFEHRQPRQIGRGLSLKLGAPWEMHVRISEAGGGGGGILIHAEVEVSRDYMQHLFSQRTPVVYEVVRILKKNGIDSRLWSSRLGGHVAAVSDDYRVVLASPALPAFAWKPMVFSIGTVGAMYLAKYVMTVLA